MLHKIPELWLQRAGEATDRSHRAGGMLQWKPNRFLATGLEFQQAFVALQEQNRHFGCYRHISEIIILTRNQHGKMLFAQMYRYIKSLNTTLNKLP